MYLDDEGTEMTVVHCFPDADSMDLHFEGADERSAAAYEFLEPQGWEIYGKPNEAAIGMMRQAATAAGVDLDRSTRIPRRLPAPAVRLSEEWLLSFESRT